MNSQALLATILGTQQPLVSPGPRPVPQVSPGPRPAPTATSGSTPTISNSRGLSQALLDSLWGKAIQGGGGGGGGGGQTPAPAPKPNFKTPPNTGYYNPNGADLTGAWDPKTMVSWLFGGLPGYADASTGGQPAPGSLEDYILGTAGGGGGSGWGGGGGASSTVRLKGGRRM